MKTMKFKTNIKCAGCIEKVTPVLNPLVGSENWKVDTENPQKILTIESDTVSETTLAEQLKNVGYTIEKVTE